ncbi:MAG TPA: beta-ketoacyl-ACP synthase III [Dissulfurispiraceae bacterium]|nr:beta-ketoacyl-ACP synthase III [Dissulfurispiraceae bacterium]
MTKDKILLSRAKIVATGSYLPDNVVTNRDIEKRVDTSDEWIMERTGIRERRIARKNQASSDLAYEASLRAIKKAGIKAKDIDLIIVASVSGDMPFPSTACLLQDRLDASNAAAFDIAAACSGFIYGLSIAENFIKSGARKRILLVGVETLSRLTDWEDRTTCVLFGDGAGAAIIEASPDDSGILSTHIQSDGSLWDYIKVPAGGSRIPCSKESVEQRLHYINMKGNETFKVAVKTLENIALEALETNKLKASQLTLLIPHQANLRIIQATAKRLGLPMEKVMLNIEKYGNTSAASIPIAMDEALATGRIRSGDYILLEAFGAGLTCGAALIRW